MNTKVVVSSLVGLGLIGGAAALTSSPTTPTPSYEAPAYTPPTTPVTTEAAVKATPKGAPKTQGCNPNYSGCLKADASDYDCAGGSGNGPYYTGRVQVIGYDQYGLDRNGNGWGCE